MTIILSCDHESTQWVLVIGSPIFFIFSCEVSHDQTFPNLTFEDYCFVSRAFQNKVSLPGSYTVFSKCSSHCSYGVLFVIYYSITQVVGMWYNKNINIEWCWFGLDIQAVNISQEIVNQDLIVFSPCYYTNHSPVHNKSLQ